MGPEEPENGGPLEPFAAGRKVVPFEPDGTSERLGWAGLEAVRFLGLPDCELRVPILTHYQLVLFRRPPEKLSLVYDEVHRHVPPPAGAVSLVPTGSSALWRWSGGADSLLIFLDPKWVARVAAEVFDLDPSRLTMPPLDGLDLPNLRAVMQLVDSELMSGNAGGPLAAESLANLLAIHLIRHIFTSQRLKSGPDGVMPQKRLRAVCEYIEEHLDGSPSLTEMAALVQLSPYHFARQFKAATGLPPHQYVIVRRVEHAKTLLQGGGDLSLMQVAMRAGFLDQSHFSRHFKRFVGVTPKQFRQL